MSNLILQGLAATKRLMWQGYGMAAPVSANGEPPPVIYLPGTIAMQLSSLFNAPPRTGRQYSTQPAQDIAATGPYVILDCKLDRRDLVGSDSQGLSAWNDYRTVTMTVYGTRADVVRGVALILGIFGRKLGAPNQPTLSYPSGARFMRWMPKGNAVIEEDKDSKAGKDVWRGIIRAEVWSIRSN